MSSWEKDGKKFSKYFVRGKDLQFLSSKKSDGDGDGDGKGSSSDVQGDDVPF